ncbi:MAG TPA: sialidase family protein [Acidimicrobiales bacterium]|nr:sialidase family protein [Acidimicrobiales bacterium]
MATGTRESDRRLRASAGVLLLLIGLLGSGAGALLLAGTLPEEDARVTGPNVPVDPAAADLRDLRANNSPSLARNPARPTNLALVNRVDMPRFSCAFHVSANGGSSWIPRTIPFPEGEETPPRCFAPDVAFDVKGTLFLSFVTLVGRGNSPNAVWLTSSRDQGRTLSVPRRVLGPLAFQTRLIADPVRAGRLHLFWLQAASVGNLLFPTTGNPVNVMTSSDGGENWDAPVQVSSPDRERVVAPSPAAGRATQLYVAYLDLGDDALDYHGGHEGRGGDPYPGPWSLVLARSLNGGGTWEETVVEEALVPSERFVVFLPPAPSVAVDPAKGRVYVAFHDARRGGADVLLWASADNGRSFGAPRRVNDTPLRDGTSQYLPKVAVAPGGRVDVLYYDRRGDRDNVMNVTSFQFSSDGGATFGPAVTVSDRSFDSRIGFGTERDLPDLGSRLALVSGTDRSLAVWTDTRAGTGASGKQDLASGVVEVSTRSGWRTPLEVVGVVLLVGAGVLGLGTVALRLRRRPFEDPVPAEEYRGGPPMVL